MMDSGGCCLRPPSGVSSARSRPVPGVYTAQPRGRKAAEPSARVLRPWLRARPEAGLQARANLPARGPRRTAADTAPARAGPRATPLPPPQEPLAYPASRLVAIPDAPLSRRPNRRKSATPTSGAFKRSRRAAGGGGGYSRGGGGGARCAPGFPSAFSGLGPAGRRLGGGAAWQRRLSVFFPFSLFCFLPAGGGAVGGVEPAGLGPAVRTPHGAREGEG